MRIAVTGSSGQIGRDLVSRLEATGHDVVRLVRRVVPDGVRDEVHWDPACGAIDTEGLLGVEAAVHLAGESVAGGRWTEARKASIRSSRVEGTRLLAGALAALEERPRVLVAASATGYYGDRGDEVLDESSPPGTGFLAETCRAWEDASEAAVAAGVRVAHLRLGVVLAPDAGALKKLKLPFQLGLGGRIGSGAQYFPWIAQPDAVAAFLHVLDRDDIRGPANVVAPEAATNLEFTKALGRVLGRPTILPLPAFAARLAFGEMADEMLLAGQRAVPKALLDSGFAFVLPALEPALRTLLAST